MAVYMQNTKVLMDILTALQRLEDRFEDQSDRLNAIELSVRSGAVSPVTFRHDVDAMTAAEYRESVAVLRNRFEFDEKSVVLQATGAVDETNDWRSVSVYSTRPHSQLALDAFQQPPPIPPRDERRTPAATPQCGRGDEKGLPFSSTRYEDMPPTPPMSSRLSSSDNQSCSQTPEAEARPAGIQVRSRNKSWQQWVHGPAQGLETAKTAFRDSGLSTRSRERLDRMRGNVIPTKDRMVEGGNRLRRAAGWAIKGCLRVVPDTIAWMGRKMVVYQMKRFDIAL